MKIIENDTIQYSTTVIHNGQEYFQSPAHQLANHICKKEYENFRFSWKKGFTSSKIFIQQIIEKGSLYCYSKFSKKKFAGEIIYDLQNDRMTLTKSVEKFEIRKISMNGRFEDFFSVHNEIFKHLRDEDVIQINTVEREIRKKIACKYLIKKKNALTNGKIILDEGFGNYFFIPVSDFYRIKEKYVRETKKQFRK